jgi:sporulation protein YlmC with PRC-barrel domain
MKIMLTSDDILGKDVLDPEGDVLGVVSKLHLKDDPYTVTGITVDQGFGYPELFVGMNHVERVGIDAIFLGARPLMNLTDRSVYDKTGAYIGEVEDVEMLDEENAVIIVRGEGERRSISKDRIREKGDVIIVDVN